jgi:hypothetical protein
MAGPLPRAGEGLQGERPVDYLVYFRLDENGPPDQCFVEADSAADAEDYAYDVRGAVSVSRVKAIPRGTPLHAACHQLVPLQRFVGPPR